MTETIDIDKNKNKYAVMALCLECRTTWIAAVIAKTKLFSLECPNCHIQNSFASFIPKDYLEEIEKIYPDLDSELAVVHAIDRKE